MKIAGSGSESESGSESGSVPDPLVRGSTTDPDPHQNVMDPQHWVSVLWIRSRKIRI
jgi:hypothetical protein